MKKTISLFLTFLLMFSICPMSFAAGHETLVSYDTQGVSEYLLTVPATLAPGSSSTVKLDGSWPSNETINVTADSTVSLTNSIDSSTKVLDISFNGISQAGDNTKSISVSETISIDTIENALFGVWSGEFYYNVSVKDSSCPLQFGRTYGIADSETQSGMFFLFNEDGSGMMASIENGEVSSQALPIGSFLFEGTEIYSADEGDISDTDGDGYILAATVSSSGDEVYFEDGPTLYLIENESNINYGNLYSATSDGITVNIVFYENGSLLVSGGGYYLGSYMNTSIGILAEINSTMSLIEVQEDGNLSMLGMSLIDSGASDLIVVDNCIYNTDKTVLRGLIYGYNLDYVILDGVQTIDDYVFNLQSGGSHINSVYIPKSVTTIGECYSDTIYINDVYYEGTEEEWNAINGWTIESTNPQIENIHYNS